MKKTNPVRRSILALFILFVFSSPFMFSSALYSQSKSGTSFYSGGHDSLLFDGQSTIMLLPEIASGCDIFVKVVKGSAVGWKAIKEIYDICGEIDTTWRYELGPLQTGDKLQPGKDIEVSEGSETEMELKYGDVSLLKVRVVNKSTLQFARTICEKMKSDLDFDPKLGIVAVLQLLNGKVHINSEESFLNKYNKGVEAVKSMMNWQFTKFTVESKVEGSDTLDILKVYEGSVDVRLKQYDNRSLETQADAIQKIYEDFQAGKITQAEMIERMKPYTEGVAKEMSEMKLTETVQAGYQITVGTKLGTPEPIGADDDRWFDDANFKK